MKLTMTFKEMEQMKRVAETIDDTSVKSLINSFKNNKLITCNADFFNQVVTVRVKEEYVVDFMKVYGNYLSILAMHGKAIMNATQMFVESADKIAERHNK